VDGVHVPALWAMKHPFVKKIWGSETWLENNDKYCAKILHLQSGYQCSLHYHNVKDETFIVLEGGVFLETYPVPEAYVNEGIGHCKIWTLYEGDKHRLKPKTPHRFWPTCWKGAIILEVSTKHDDADVVRLEESKKICLTDSTTD
jgi:D-lyxose ketol-isomerase